MNMHEEKLDLIFDENLVEQEEQQELEYGTFWNRLWAYLVDFIVLQPLTLINIYNFYVWPKWWNPIVVNLIIIVVYASYKPIMEGAFGRTLGKRLLKLKVIKDSRTPIDHNTAITRYIPWIPALLINVYFATIEYKTSLTNDMATFVWLNFSQLSFSVFVLICGISIAFSDNKQGLHDRLAKTLCIKDA